MTSHVHPQSAQREVAAGGPSSGVLDAAPRDRSGVRRTLLALLASGLGATPLRAVLSDSGWLFEAWLTMIIVIAPAVLLRLRRAPGALDIWPGIILLIPWLTRLFVAKHAYGGFIPSRATMTDIARLMDSLHKTTHDDVAPIHSTVAVRLVVCALLGLLVALIDLIAVVGHRGALAGVPLLVVYTVSGAVPRDPVAWGWFAVAAIGYLILLQLDAADELRAWGRQISRTGGERGRLGSAFSAHRIGVVAVAVAVVLPFLVPAHPRNFIADAFHSGGGSGGSGGFGAGGNGGTISPFVSLKNQLQRGKPVALMTVHVQGASTAAGYVRVNVLNHVTTKGWGVSDHGVTEPLGATGFDTDPPAVPPRVQEYQADFSISGATGNPPVFADPTDVTGLPAGAAWSSRDQLLLGTNINRDQRFREDVDQPDPTVTQLQAAPAVDRRQFASYLTLPAMPKFVTDLVATITRGRTNPYDRARAISNYFANPSNGFIYTLKTKDGDSGSDLVDFLKNRSGFCQQYAAAMAIMLRVAQVPSRVVLGYMHPQPDSEGNFTITTSDAHSWVESYFPGIGWIPFDPTPTAGLVGGRKSDLPWAPHVYTSGTIQGEKPSKASSAPAHRPSEQNSAAAVPTVAAPSGGSDLVLLWVALGLVVLIGLGLIPAGVRAGRRRRRLLAARRGDADALWAELSDTAVDLGYVWSPARSPRQVSEWLARDAADSAGALTVLATAVEHRRYAPQASAGTGPGEAAELARGLHEVTSRLRSRRSAGARLRATLLPASLGWSRLTRLLPAARRR